eukprot:scaffold2594_cov134-Pinguiococcus_pyrenoidosus.AAC.1
MPLPPRSRLVSCVTWGSPCVARAWAPSSPRRLLQRSRLVSCVTWGSPCVARAVVPLCPRRLSLRPRLVSCGTWGSPCVAKAWAPSGPMLLLRRSSVVPPSPYALRTLVHHPGSPPYSAGQVGALRSLMVPLCGARVATKMAHSAGNARDEVLKKDFQSQVSTFISD